MQVRLKKMRRMIHGLFFPMKTVHEILADLVCEHIAARCQLQGAMETNSINS